LDEQFPQLNLDVEKHFKKRMRDLVIDTILSGKKELLKVFRKN